jgi:hypothetical protein
MKHSFSVYFRSFSTYSKTDLNGKFNWEYFILYFFVLVICGMTAGDTNYEIVVDILATFILISCVIVAVGMSVRPNLITALPISYKRKIAYQYLLTLSYFLLMVVGAVLMCALIGGIVVGIVALTGAFGESGATEEVVEETTRAMGVYGGLFAAGFFVMCYGIGMLASFIRERKKRNIALFSCFGGVLVVAVIMRVAGGDIGPFAEECFKNMAAPVVAIVVWLLLAVVALGASVYMGYRELKPKEY